jgi:hypothetical protein
MKMIILMGLPIIAVACGLFVYVIYRERIQVKKERRFLEAQGSGQSFSNTSSGGFSGTSNAGDEPDKVLTCFRMDWFIWLARYFFIGMFLPGLAIVMIEFAEAIGAEWITYGKKFLDISLNGMAVFFFVFAGLIVVFINRTAKLVVSGRGVTVNGEPISVKSFQISEIFPMAQMLYLRTPTRVWMLMPMGNEELRTARKRYTRMDWKLNQIQQEEKRKQVAKLRNYLTSRSARPEIFSDLSRNLWLLGSLFAIIYGLAFVLLMVNHG